MRECECAKPRPAVDPRQAGKCRCGGTIAPEWSSSDETMRAFFDRLEAVVRHGPDSGATFEAFRRHCAERERDGRHEFGFAYLARNNPVEGTEEAADLANYAFFDTLVAARDGDEHEAHLALEAALHAYRAHDALLRLAAARGKPR